jgi:hypothetical protein
MARQTKAGEGTREGIAQALARGLNVRAAAAECKVGERTVHRWLREDAAFVARVQELRELMFSLAAGRLCELSAGAADELGRLLSAKTETVRLGAAKAILECAAKLRESLDVARRLAALEEQLGEGQD